MATEINSFWCWQWQWRQRTLFSLV